MIKIFIKYCLIFITLFSNIYFVFGQDTKIDTLSLEYDRIDSPPFCYIPQKLIRRPKVGLALSGGGARGFAQIGVLQILEEHDIPIDIIVGSSMGSIVGGLYAAGYSPQEIEQLAQSIDWSKIMIDKPPRTSLFIGQKQERGRAVFQIRFKGLKPAIPQGITPGQKLTTILTNLTLRANYQISSDFDKLKIPFRAIACDLISGKKITIGSGNLAEAMKASSAVPLLFSPVARDTLLLVDGGLVNNIPVDEVRDFDVDLVIGVDTVSKLREKEKLRAPWEIADQVTTIMQREKNAAQRESADVIIKVDMADYKSDNFQQINDIIQAGRKEAAKRIDEIKKIIVQKSKKTISLIKYPVGSLKVSGIDDSLRWIAEEIIPQEIRYTASYQDIYHCLEDIYQTGYFKHAKAICTLKDSTLTINYAIIPNPTLNSIVFEGNTIFSDSVLLAQMQSEFGKPINYHNAKRDISNITRLYNNSGIASAIINEIEFLLGSLRIDIDEGTISSINIDGNDRTKDYVILREFPLKPGDIFNINKANDGLNNIHSTGLFETVTFEVLRDKHLVRLNIKVKEKAFNLIRFSYRHDLERKNRGMIEFVDENVIGSGNQVTLHGQYGRKDQTIHFRFRADRIFNSFLTNNFDVFHCGIKNFTYSEGKQTGEYLQKESGFSFSFGRQIERLGIFSVITTFNLIELKRASGYGFPTGEYELKTIALQSIVDTQDQFPFPRAGKYYQFFYKMSSANFLNSQISFVKLFNSIEVYHTFLKRNTIHPKLFWGTSDLTTPFIEQFRLGGQSSFYGLRENEKVGRHIIVESFEYRYQFPFGFPINVYWSLRYDIGATWKNQLDINPKDFLHGLGTSLSLETPVGPINFSFGRSSQGKNVFYFSAGFQF